MPDDIMTDIYAISSRLYPRVPLFKENLRHTTVLLGTCMAAHNGINSQTMPKVSLVKVWQVEAGHGARATAAQQQHHHPQQ